MPLGGVPGVSAADVVIIGGGVVGTNAARMAMGMEARVTVLDTSVRRLAELDMQFGPVLNTIFATVDSIERYVEAADLINRAMVRDMRRGAVIVDVAIDQGGVSETSRPTTHTEPTYIVDEVVHYCVTDMPGAVARTSTFALNNATLPYVLKLADQGWRGALATDDGFAASLDVHAGAVTHAAVAADLGYEVSSPSETVADSNA